MKKICVALCLICSLMCPMQVCAAGSFPTESTETTQNGQFPEEDVEEWQENQENQEEKVIEWYQIVEGGTLFRSGGINKIDGEKVETEEEMQALETELQNSGYVQVTGEGKDISSEDYALLEEHYKVLSFGNWIKKDSKYTEYYNTYFRVYMYKPVYEDLIAQLKENGRLEIITGREMSTSTVVINEAEWYHKSRIGQIVTEYNNQLPSWVDGGFLQIESPIDACVTMMYTSGQYYVQFFVNANEPFLVRVRAGGYYVTSINAEGIAVEEETLMYSNTININVKDHTENEPKILSIEQVVKKYDIAPLENIEEKPDYSWGNRWEYAPIEDIPEEEVTVEQEQQDKSQSLSKTVWTIILVSVFAVVVIAVFVAYKIIKKKYAQY